MHKIGIDGTWVLTHLVGQIGSPVQLGVSRDDIAALVGVAVDEGGNAGQLGNEVNAVLHDGLPVVQLVDALGIG